MGHAGAIISGSSGLAADKIAALNAVGVPVADVPSEVPALVKRKLEAVKKGKPSQAAKEVVKRIKTKKIANKPASRRQAKAKRTKR